MQLWSFITDSIKKSIISATKLQKMECWDKEMENYPIASEKVINGVTCKFREDK